MSRRALRPAHRAWCQLVDGYCVDLAEPTLDGLAVGTLAHHLARLNRWCGGTAGRHGYSVAQHSVVALHALLADDGAADQLAGRAVLLHDAHEICTGDVPSPAKSLCGPGLRLLEDRLDLAVRRRFGLPEVLPPPVEAAVRRADMVALATEARDLLGPAEWPWRHELPEPLPERITPMPAEDAERYLLGYLAAWGLA